MRWLTATRSEPVRSAVVAPPRQVLPMPTRIVRCPSCGALTVDGAHADSGLVGCGFPREAA